MMRVRPSPERDNVLEGQWVSCETFEINKVVFIVLKKKVRADVLQLAEGVVEVRARARGGHGLHKDGPALKSSALSVGGAYQLIARKPHRHIFLHLLALHVALVL
jgi:hypothetical protein